MRYGCSVGLVVVGVLAFSGGGCKRGVFEPGSYALASVVQVTGTGETGQEQSTLKSTGTLRFSFSEDGSFVAVYGDYSVNYEEVCRGEMRGTWSVQGDLLEMKRTESTLPRRCRVERTRQYRWERGFLGGLSLWREWDENVWIVYQFDSM